MKTSDKVVILAFIINVLMIYVAATIYNAAMFISGFILLPITSYLIVYIIDRNSSGGSGFHSPL